MMDSEAYTFVTTTSHHQVWDDYVDVNSGQGYNLDTYLQAALRRQYPELALTVTIASNGMFLLHSPSILHPTNLTSPPISQSPRLRLRRPRNRDPRHSRRIRPPHALFPPTSLARRSPHIREISLQMGRRVLHRLYRAYRLGFHAIHTQRTIGRGDGNVGKWEDG